MSKMYCQITMPADEILFDKNARVLMGLNGFISKNENKNININERKDPREPLVLDLPAK